MTRFATWMMLLSGSLAGQPLTLEDVLRSLEANYPPLLATLLERDVAAGANQQALGQFDTQLGMPAQISLGTIRTNGLISA